MGKKHKGAWGRRKDTGRSYPKEKMKAATEHNISNHGSAGMTVAMIKKIENKNRRRGRTAVLTDLGKKARIDKVGKKWLKTPNRFDVVGIDAKITVKKK